VDADADECSPHVAEADRAVRLPGNAPVDTYLRADLVIDAARRAGADAVHPGYGFLSENAGFAAAVEAAGFTWIGPPVAAIESMGSKIESKRLMAAAGVPVLDELAPDAVTEADLPVLVKASAGGGGRGMRVVRSLADLPGELEAAAAEAGSAFGDPTVFCEPYLATGRHIEVQVMADRHGTVWAVGERECSIQRRHQKIVEEAPSPLVERVPGMRERLFEASVAAARTIGYMGAGTVEFLADDDGRFFFLEMNTRLQVEHPVTEMTCGVDLVEWMVRLGAGDTSFVASYEHRPQGHAIEVRLYAEDPAAGWQPQSGRLHRFEVPGVTAELEVPAGVPSGLRLDAGVVSGLDVSIHYDPMLAKVIAWAPNRADAARRLAGALRRSRIHGVVTNRDLLVRILGHRAFLAGETDTAFLDRHGLAGPDGLAAPLVANADRHLLALAAALAQAAANRQRATVLGGLPSGWRNVWSQHQEKRYRGGDQELVVRYTLGRDGLLLGPTDDQADGQVDDHAAVDRTSIELVTAAPDRVVLAVDGVSLPFDVATHADLVVVDSPLGSLALQPVSRFPDPDHQAAPGSLLAPMPGSVVRVAVAEGDEVSEGQVLLWLEAMKMQHEVRAPLAGVVAELAVAAGQQVEVGEVLAVVRPADELADELAEPDTDPEQDQP
jgi:propionyl-CoA carboxylase alpha chain